MIKNLSSMSKRKKFAWAVTIALICFGLDWIYDYATGDFRLANITIDDPYTPEFKIPQLHGAEMIELQNILNQEFTFLGKGNQVYAFESEDGKYVLKFFKFGHLKPSYLVDRLPSVEPFVRYREHSQNTKRKKIDRIFNAYSIAYLHDKKNTGIVYAHLNKSSDLKQAVTVVDKLGMAHTIDLDSVVFVVQKKAEPLKEILEKSLKENDVKAAKQRLHEIIDMYISEYRNGIFDNDHNVIYNIGFADGHPMRLDAGKIVLDQKYQDPDLYKKDLEKIVYKRIDKWLSTYHPQHRIEIVADLKRRLEAEFTK